VREEREGDEGEMVEKDNLGGRAWTKGEGSARAVRNLGKE
jgi:hypothetical protein